MKVKTLIDLLKKEDPNATVLVWLSKDEGWQVTEVGVGDAIIGNMTDGYPCKSEYVLLPIECPEVFEDWADDINKLN